MHAMRSLLIISSASISASCVLGALLLLPTPEVEDRANHDPLLVTSESNLKFSEFGDSSVVMSRIIFGPPSKVSFSSSDESVCSVNENGVVTAVGDGTATITVKADNPESENPIEKHVDVVVERAPQSVTTDWNWTGLSAGAQAHLGAVSSSGCELTFSSSDENVARVSPDGTVEAVSPGSAVISAVQPGDDRLLPAEAEATVVVVEGDRDRMEALEPFFEAMRVQQQWSWNATYGGGQVTIENSKVVGNCTTFPTASLQRVGLLPEPTIVWPHARHAKAHPEYFERFTPRKTTAQLVANGELLVGDIVRFNTPMMHSMVYMGWNEEGNYPMWNTGGRAGGTQGSRPALFKRLKVYEPGIIDDVLRIRTYTINVSWKGNGIVGGGGEVMARQDCTITFDAQQGSTLTKLVVDGVEQEIEPGMRSYTFNEVVEPHSIEVSFE